MSTLSELVSAHTDLTGDDIDRLHSLVADWAMLADLSFADLLLCVRMKDSASDEYLVVAQVRPATGPTIYAEDMVAQTLAPLDAVDRGAGGAHRPRGRPGVGARGAGAGRGGAGAQRRPRDRRAGPRHQPLGDAFTQRAGAGLLAYRR